MYQLTSSFAFTYLLKELLENLKLKSSAHVFATLGSLRPCSHNARSIWNRSDLVLDPSCLHGTGLKKILVLYAFTL